MLDAGALDAAPALRACALEAFGVLVLGVCSRAVTGAFVLEVPALALLDELSLGACALDPAAAELALGAAGSVDRHAAHAIKAQLASRTTRDEVSMELELERTLSPCR